MDLTYSYIKKRSDFGRQPRFCEVPAEMLDSINPNVVLQKQFCLRNPVNQASQASMSQSEHDINTKTITFTTEGVNHAEGGWPKDIHFADEESTSRYRRRAERDDSYVDAVNNISPKLEHYIHQNNAIEMYELYFNDLPFEKPIEKSSIRLKNVYRDNNSRQIADLCWVHEDDSKIVATYCDKKFPVTKPVNKPLLGYVWNLEMPLAPLHEFHPPSACWQIVSSPVHPSIIIGGLEDGRVCIFDLRHDTTPVTISSVHDSHREPVSSLMYLYSRVNTEFFSGSSDGRCMWWDIRNISLPIDILLISIFIPIGQQVSMANVEPVSVLQYDRTLPSKFLCGTDTGYVVSVNRKGKSYKEMMANIYAAHNGPVKALHRSPCTTKMFITCGDWTVHIWSEDITTAPIITGTGQHHKINDVAWAPQRVSSYMSVSADGKFRYWDLLRKYREPVLVFPLSKHPLLKVKPQDEGRFIAMGDIKGNIYLTSISDNLVYTGDKEKPLMSQLYERETRRERIIETRIKEIRLKLKTEDVGTDSTAAAAPEDVDEESVIAATEEEYKRIVQEEIRRTGITQSTGKERPMRQR